MKWVYLALAIAFCALAFLTALAPGSNDPKIAGEIAAGLVWFVCFFVRDWRDFERLRRSQESERALSHERAKIIGEFVHTRRRGRDA